MTERTHDHEKDEARGVAARPLERGGRTREPARGEQRGAEGGLQRSVGNAALTRLFAQRRGEASLPTGRAGGGDPDHGAMVRAATASGGQPLDGGVRRSLEAHTGADLSGVRIHTGGSADAAAGSLGAEAFTVGSDVVFGPGQYDPGSRAGLHRLAHEVTHVVQQRSGPVSATDTGTGVAVSDPADSFERAAEASAHDFLGAADRG